MFNYPKYVKNWKIQQKSCTLAQEDQNQRPTRETRIGETKQGNKPRADQGVDGLR